MGLLGMILGLALFLGVHALTTQRELRARVIASSGEGGYKIGYSLVSALGLVLIVWGFAHYRAAGMWEVWTPPTALKHLAAALRVRRVFVAECLETEYLLSFGESCGGEIVGRRRRVSR